MSGSSRVAAGIFSSRAVGLIREILIGGILGRSNSAEAFRVAMRVPNIIQNLLGEGAISASFVPVFAGLVEEGDETGRSRLAASVLGHLAALVSLLVVVTIVLARPLVWLVTLGNWSGDRYEWAIELTRITAAGAGLLVLASLCLGILNSHRQYFLPYAAPMLWSGAQIVVLLGILVWADGGTELSSSARNSLAAATVVGASLQLGVQLPAVRRLVSGFRPRLDRDDNVREVFRRFVPALTARGVVQLSSFLDLALASFLAAGAVATLGMVTPLYLISIGVFGFSVATSELTEISRSGLLDSAVARRVRIGVRRVLLPTGLVTPILIVAAPVVIDGLYGWLNRLVDFSTLNESGLTVTALTLSAFALGLPAAMQARVTQNALFALGDVKGPAKISLVRLAVVAVVGFLLMMQLDHLAVDQTTDAIGPSEDRVDQLDTRLTPLGVSVEASGLHDEAVELNEFPHWPVWEPLPSAARENLGDSGIAPLGPVGLGLASAVASWTEFFLLRRRLRRSVANPVASGIVVSVAAGASVVAVIALAFRLFVSDLPSPVPMLLLGPAALVGYVATLTALGLGPFAPSGAQNGDGARPVA
ncbi:MAG: hypothetical protein HKN24_13755 [Acidimicrobiales bacterium]|nr:hypothetical protein [Acidimicrobiales bacterium]